MALNESEGWKEILKNINVNDYPNTIEDVTEDNFTIGGFEEYITGPNGSSADT